jgi:hypothetical protein
VLQIGLTKNGLQLGHGLLREQGGCGLKHVPRGVEASLVEDNSPKTRCVTSPPLNTAFLWADTWGGWLCVPGSSTMNAGMSEPVASCWCTYKWPLA